MGSVGCASCAWRPASRILVDQEVFWNGVSTMTKALVVHVCVSCYDSGVPVNEAFARASALLLDYDRPATPECRDARCNQ